MLSFKSLGLDLRITPSLSLPRAPHIPPGRSKIVVFFVFAVFFSIFWPFEKHFKICFRFFSKKCEKSMILAFQNLSTILPKRLQNRCPKKHAIFHRFLFEKCSVAKMPTSIPYWFLQYKMALGRFSSSCFLRGFGIQKTIQKPLKNHARATQKSISKTCCFLTSIFSRFGLDFGASWASKSAALLAAPGVLKPTAFYACINILHFLTRGWEKIPKWRSKPAMLALCWCTFRPWAFFFRCSARLVPKWYSKSRMLH